MSDALDEKKEEKNEAQRYFGDVNSNLKDGIWIQGWAWDRQNPEMPLIIELFVDGALWGSTCANLYREDLVKGVRNGNQGFLFPAPVSLCDEAAHRVQIRIIEPDLFFPAQPKAIPFPFPHHTKVEFQTYKNKIALREKKLDENKSINASLRREIDQLQQSLVECSTLLDQSRNELEQLKQANRQLQQRMDQALQMQAERHALVQHMEKKIKENQTHLAEIESLLA